MQTQFFIISVVIPAHNAGAFISRAIESVLKQTRPADEIIVVDDGSTDKTADIVRSYGGKVTLLRQANAGVGAARNAGIEAAQGEWIAFLDADDEWLPIRLERQLAILRRSPWLAWVTGNYLSCLAVENRCRPYGSIRKIERLLDAGETLPDYLHACMQGLGGHTDTMLIRKQVLLEAGLFRTDLKKAEDIDLWWRIAYRYPAAGCVAEPIAIYHLASPLSLNMVRTDGVFFADLLKRHLELSKEHGKGDEFRRLASVLLRGWIRSMLFSAQKKEIRFLLGEFKSLLPAWYRAWMYGLTTFPRITAAACRWISKVVRTLRLRRRVVPKPAAAPPKVRAEK